MKRVFLIILIIFIPLLLTGCDKGEISLGKTKTSQYIDDLKNNKGHSSLNVIELKDERKISIENFKNVENSSYITEEDGSIRINLQ